MEKIGIQICRRHLKNTSNIRIIVRILLHIKSKLFIFLCFFVSLAFPGVLHFENVTRPQGLADTIVRETFQDSHGFLWISTDDGLHRFDGYNFKAYKNNIKDSSSIISNRIWRVSEDKHGDLWIAAAGGVTHYIRSRDSFINYDLSKHYSFGNFAVQSVAVFVDSKERVWIGTTAMHALLYNREKNSFAPVAIQSNYSTNSDAFVGCFAEDKKGTIWASSSAYGLIYYDDEAECFRHANMNPQDLQILQEQKGFRVHADSNNDIWIMTRTDLYKYSPEFKNMKHLINLSSVQRYTGVREGGMWEDSKGNLWVVHIDNGDIIRFKDLSNDFEIINFEITGQRYGHELLPTNIMIDSFGIMWISSLANGIYKYDPSKELFKLHQYDASNNNSLSANLITSICQSVKNPEIIYIGTPINVCNVLNRNTGHVERFQFKSETPGVVNCMVANPDGTVWIGLSTDGLVKWNPNTNQLTPYFADSSVTLNLYKKFINILEKDQYGNLWIGTETGLYIMRPDERKLENIPTEYSRELSNELIARIKKIVNKKEPFVSILKVGDKADSTVKFDVLKPAHYLAISVGEGVAEMSQMLQDYGWIDNDKSEKVWTAVNLFSSFHLSGALKNRISVGILTLDTGEYSLHYKSDENHSYGNFNDVAPMESAWWGIQLVEIDTTQADTLKEKIKNEFDKPSINAVFIQSLLVDDKNVWIGSLYGLNRYNAEENSVQLYRHDPENPKSLNLNIINDIHKDSDGIFWLATQGGLNRFDPDSATFSVYHESDGLPSDHITAILQDDSGSMWLSTKNGISRMKFDALTEHINFFNYGIEDGLQGYEYNENVALKDDMGHLYFGGRNGLNQITPFSMNINGPELIFTDIKINNKPIFHSQKDPIYRSTFHMNKINLAHDQNNILVEYKAIHSSRPGKNEYAHFLQGYDDNWNKDNNPFAIYTALEPGTYKLKIQGSNRYCMNSSEKILTINIAPPWWKTWGAYAMYGVIFLGLLWSGRRVDLNRRKEKETKRLLEAENKRKSEELEVARTLQLSLLPQILPNLSHLDIAVYMQTATEVGGDYYDFNYRGDDILTVAIGDATDHGMRAGNMVVSIKSLFKYISENIAIPEFFNRCNTVLKDMNMKKVYMALTLVRIKKDTLTISSSGMPPAYLFKKIENKITEILIKGMPLGALKNFAYKEQSYSIERGDVLLLMSDGLPELFNEQKDIFDYERVENIFLQTATQSPKEIIDELLIAANQWRGQEPQADDMTFVVIKFV